MANDNRDTYQELAVADHNSVISNAAKQDTEKAQDYFLIWAHYIQQYLG